MSQLANQNHSAIARSNTAGFSLVEILIALVIGTLLVSLSVIVFADKRGDRLDEEARRIYLLMQLAQDEAMLRGVEIGVRFEPDRYWFYSLDPQTERWLPIEADDFFTEKPVSEDFEVKLVVEGEALFGDDEDEVAIFDEDVNVFDEEVIEPPQLYVLSSGEVSPFKLAIGWVDDDPRYYLLSGDFLGRLVFDGPLSGDLKVEVTSDGES